MAYYAYKHVRDLLPKHIIDAQGPDYEGNGNYDGDQWYAAQDYILELIDQRDTARAELAKLANAELPEPLMLMLPNQPETAVYSADQLRQAYAQGAAAQLSSEAIATVTSNSLSDYSEIGRTYQAPIPIGTPLYTRRQA